LIARFDPQLSEVLLKHGLPLDTARRMCEAAPPVISPGKVPERTGVSQDRPAGFTVSRPA
jgi:hypothetical protein